MERVNTPLSRRSFVAAAAALGAATVLTGTAYAADGASAGKDAGKGSGKGGGKGKQVAIAASDDPSIVIDAQGNEVAVPEKIERVAITCNGGATHEAVIFGGPDKIVAEPSMEAFPQLLKMFPVLNDVVNGGSFDDVNVETIAAQAPDIVLCGVSSEKGNAQIREVGMSTYVMLIGWAAVDTLKQEFLNVGHLFGNDERAEELVAYWDDMMSKIAERVAKLTDEQRARKVYYLGSPVITKANTGDWGRVWVDTIGATFAVPDEDLNGDVTIEKALGWNPDVIVVQGGKDLTELTSDPAVQDIAAIQNGEVYSCPIGAFWWDRPSPEAPLGFLWLAQTVFPGVFDDIDLHQETVDFFKRFYNYDLPQDEYDAFFGGAAK
ncbi:MAG: ABC transporter substrate-binding protein [Coriobacteriia bacterium]|nr:ABC transporter substrate-binding protein [Coriobacteriia bacterium]MBS5478736.1 ABC transporter substrate-binding protein [Coriobacteriia bacterium]